MYANGYFRVGNVGPLALDPLQVVRDLTLAEQQRHVAAALQGVLGELDAVIGHLRELFESLLLLLQSLLLGVAHLGETGDQLFAPDVDCVC